jgi:uncharacterized membrane protein
MKYAKDFRASARLALSGKWWEAVVAGILASLLGVVNSTGGVIITLNFVGSEDSTAGNQTGTTVNPFADPEFLSTFLTVFGIVFGVILVVGIAFFIIGSIVSPGYAKYNLDLIDGNYTEIRTLFNYFVHWKKVIVANLLKGIFIALWSLLFIIPGIFAIYNYAMVPYILAEDPTIAPSEALKKSKAMMYGNRWRLFCLEISFIGWAILAALTFGIGGFWLIPYEQAAFADFYREISSTRPEDEIAIDIIEEV